MLYTQFCNCILQFYSILLCDLLYIKLFYQMYLWELPWFLEIPIEIRQLSHEIFIEIKFICILSIFTLQSDFIIL